MKSIRERTESRYTGEDVTAYAFYDDNRYRTHGLKNVTAEEDQLDDAEESYEDVANDRYYATSGFSDQYVQRLGLSEVRLLNLHINSSSFHHSINKVLRVIVAKALFSQVDCITLQVILIFSATDSFRLTWVDPCTAVLLWKSWKT